MCYLYVCNNRYGLGRIEQALFPPLIWTLGGLENMRTGILIRVQRYKNILEHANFETEKVKFLLFLIQDTISGN